MPKAKYKAAMAGKAKAKAKASKTPTGGKRKTGMPRGNAMAKRGKGY